jgi:hypothetical protein
VSWWRRKKHDPDSVLDEYVARERAEVQAVHDDTRRQAAETRSLKAESSRVHERAKKIREQNHFTHWLTQALRGVQEDGR